MKILAIFPHPDDETIFCGGTIARHIEAGDEVVWICAGFGERSGRTGKRYSPFFYWIYLLMGKFTTLIFFQKLAVWWLSIFRKRDMKLAEIRRKEALDAADVLGISKVHFLEVEDMKFGKFKANIKEKIKKYFNLYKPDIIYTFHPNGLTGHPDHAALSKSVIEAAREIYGEEQPEIYGVTVPKSVSKKFKIPLLSVKDNEIKKEIVLSEEELAKKKGVLAKYQSQNYIWEVFIEKHPEVLEREYFARLL
jgi:LmbE family N-acetylglucosaminyl deacetylase